MRPAIPKRQDVMHFLHWGQPAFFLAHLTQWVGEDVLRSDPFPVCSISLLGIGIAPVSVVVVVNLCLVFWAVLFMR